MTQAAEHLLCMYKVLNSNLRQVRQGSMCYNSSTSGGTRQTREPLGTDWSARLGTQRRRPSLKEGGR